MKTKAGLMRMSSPCLLLSGRRRGVAAPLFPEVTCQSAAVGGAGTLIMKEEREESDVAALWLH